MSTPLSAPHPMRRATDPRRTRHSVSLVIPADSQTRALPWVLEQVPRHVDEVLLVCGSPADAGARMAASLRPSVRILCHGRRGRGDALSTGFRAARCDYVVAMNADGSMCPGEIPHYLHFLDHGYDFVQGSRHLAGGGSQERGRLRTLGDRALLAVANHLYGTCLTDLGYGFCAFRRSALDVLDPHVDGFEVGTELVVHALRGGLRIAEVPSLELPCRGAACPGAAADAWRVLRVLLAERPGAGSRAEDGR